MKRISLIPSLLLAASVLTLTACGSALTSSNPIDRQALLARNAVEVTTFDSLASLSVGNGNFAFTVDATGLQSYPDKYRLGVPLGTQSSWGWHSFPNVLNLKPEEAFKTYNFHGHEELYAVQFNEPGRQRESAEYYRINPHRLHLGYFGLDVRNAAAEAVPYSALTDIHQQLDMWKGEISSSFASEGQNVETRTFCDPALDAISVSVKSALLSDGRLRLRWSFPYPSGGHSDDASDWNYPEKHQTLIVASQPGEVLLQRILDDTQYYVRIAWEGEAEFAASEQEHVFYLSTTQDSLLCTTWFEENPAEASEGALRFASVEAASTARWESFWQNGGIVDFSQCTDARAPELERRVVLSQYLTAIQCAGIYPPQESGLTYNTWYGKYHLEMHWWHGVHFALWGRDELLQPSMEWYNEAAGYARGIAERQGYKGLRWMKMTDPSAIEAPSKVGSFLLWQQPHYIYLAELIYRNHPDSTILNRYKDLVFETAEFLADFVDYDGLGDRYIIQGIIPAQETLRASETVNPPFELSYVHFALQTAQQWRVRLGMQKNMEWETILDKLSPLAYNGDKLYLAAETAEDTYIDTRYTSDHMAVLGALGMMPESRLVRKDIMSNTFDWIWDNWNWGKTWGWDYPMTAMCAARLGRKDKAVDALLMDRRTNTYLVNGHNYQDSRLRLYMPGNGGLLTAVAMMCAGWDGNDLTAGQNSGTFVKTAAFPDDGTWNVRWEGLKPMP